MHITRDNEARGIDPSQSDSQGHLGKTSKLTAKSQKKSLKLRSEKKGDFVHRKRAQGHIRK